MVTCRHPLAVLTLLPLLFIFVIILKSTSLTFCLNSSAMKFASLQLIFSFISIGFLLCHTSKESKVLLRRWDTPRQMRSLRNSDSCRTSLSCEISGSLYHLSKPYWHVVKICLSCSLEHIIYRAFLPGN